MSLEQCFITPGPVSNQTIPEGTTFLPIHPISLWSVGAIPSIHVFPAALDIQQLEGAIQKVAGLWPNICGRYVNRSEDGTADFGIELTGSPIPLSVQTLDDIQGKAFPNTLVIQSSLAPYLPPLGDMYFYPNSGAHLVSFRLTILPDKSVLGINWSHILGDAASFNAFIRCLSDFYTGDVPDLTPTFSPHIKLRSYPPSQDVTDRYKITQLEPTELEDMRKAYSDAVVDTEMIVVTLSRGDVLKLREGFEKEISDQDVLSGWWISVLSRAGTRVDKIIYTINYRNLHPGRPGFPANLPTLSANVAQMRAIPIHSTSTQDVAKTIRAELIKLRNDPDMTLEWLSNAAYQLEQAALQRLGQVMVPEEGTVVINSNLRYDWNLSFGFPSNQTSFHTSFSTVGFLRVFQANPHTGQEGNVELILNVQKGMREGVERIVDTDRASW